MFRAKYSKLIIVIIFSCLRSIWSWSRVPITKIYREPVLCVQDQSSGCNIQLVGVSHGAESSAQLVRRVINEVKPGVVVLELCDDRFISISLDAELVPRELKWEKRYNDNMARLKMQKVSQKGSRKLIEPLSNLFGAFQFVRGQGFVGGIFVTMGLLVSGMQRVGASPVKDEFTTATIEAYKYDIPVRMGDADQNATLKSLRQIVSPQTFDPKEVINGAKALAFSAFGLLPYISNHTLGEKCTKELLQQSQWISIPQAYIDNAMLIKGLAPIFGFSAMLALLGLFVDGTSESSPFIQEGIPSPSFELWTSLVQSQEDVAHVVDFCLDSFAFLTLIRLTKIIGTDRDAIIAHKVKQVAEEFKVGQHISSSRYTWP